MGRYRKNSVKRSGPFDEPPCSENSEAAVFRKSALILAKTLARYWGHLGPSGPKLQIESENEFPGLSASGSKEVQNGVEKSQNRLFFDYFDSFPTPFGLFGPGAEGARELIFRLYFQLWA